MLFISLIIGLLPGATDHGEIWKHIGMYTSFFGEGCSNTFHTPSLFINNWDISQIRLLVWGITSKES